VQAKTRCGRRISSKAFDLAFLLAPGDALVAGSKEIEKKGLIFETACARIPSVTATLLLAFSYAAAG
jgi:hypothetical protein